MSCFDCYFSLTNILLVKSQISLMKKKSLNKRQTVSIFRTGIYICPPLDSQVKDSSEFYNII